MEGGNEYLGEGGSVTQAAVMVAGIKSICHSCVFTLKNGYKYVLPLVWSSICAFEFHGRVLEGFVATNTPVWGMLNAAAMCIGPVSFERK